jgi:hypothetical protein
MQKLEYEQPEIELFLINEEDIITTSGLVKINAKSRNNFFEYTKDDDSEEDE